MSKLVYIVTRKKNCANLTRDLLTNGFYITELEGWGGFSREKLSLILLGTDESKIESLLKIIKKHCSTQEEITVNGVPLPSLGQEDLLQSHSSDKVRVKVGGATVFIAPLDKIEKV
jgi:uncharacterized protein YaaQ